MRGVKLIVGLGNPGRKYAQTRHNVGFWVIDRLTARLECPDARSKDDALTTEVKLGNEQVILLKPQTFMNNSGVAVARALRYRACEPNDMLVVYDDVNLPLGRIRLRASGSNGGHNGMKSIIAHLHSQEFPRLRIGVGDKEPGSDLTQHVLGTFRPEQRSAVDAAVATAVEAVQCFIAYGIDRAMNEFNV